MNIQYCIQYSLIGELLLAVNKCFTENDKFVTLLDESTHSTARAAAGVLT